MTRWTAEDFWATHTCDLNNPHNSFDAVVRKVHGYTATLGTRSVGVYIDGNDKLWLVDIKTGAHIDVTDLMHVAMRPSEWMDEHADKISAYIEKYTTGWWHDDGYYDFAEQMIDDAYNGDITDDGYYKTVYNGPGVKESTDPPCPVIPLLLNDRPQP